VALGSGTVTLAGGTALAFATTGDFMIANGNKLRGDPTFFFDNGHTDAATIVEAGTLAAGSSTGFSAASALAVAAGAVLDVGGSQVTIDSLSDAGGSGGIVKDGDALATGLTTGTDKQLDLLLGTIEDGANALSLTIGGDGHVHARRCQHLSGATTVKVIARSRGMIEVETV
jgi:hypothetical protein